MSHSVEKEISVSEEIRCCQEQAYDEDYSILIGMVFAARTFAVGFLIEKRIPEFQFSEIHSLNPITNKAVRGEAVG